MKCPYCAHLGDKVVDSRESKEGEVIRRRRECLSCGRRFTSYERIDEIPYMVVKKDGSRERFERQKLIAGLLKACEKRPVSVAALETILPRRMAHLTARLAGLFAEGLAVARDPGRLLVSLTWSVLLWLSIGFGIWTTSRAFHIDIPFSASFLLIALLSVGVAVPTPGGVGGFHEEIGRAHV